MAISFGAPLAVYIPTLAPTLYGLDSAELTTAAYCLGLVHSPGYPLYLLIGHLFTHLPVGSVAYRMNLMSAFFGALTAAFTFLLLLRLGRRWLISLSAALLLAFSFFFWSPALMAEVYTLHAFLMVVVFHIALKWEQQQHDRWLFLLALTFGLGMGNHVSTLLLLPGLLYWLWAKAGRRLLHPARMLRALLFVVLGLSVYLYLPLRYAAAPPTVGAMEIQIASWQDLADVVSARIFWGLVFPYSMPQLYAEAVDYLYCLWGNFLGIGLAAGFFGIVNLFLRRRHLATALLLAFLAHAIFFIGYGAGDKRLMFVPTYVIWALWVGFGYEWLLERVDSLFDSKGGSACWQLTTQGLFLAIALTALVVNYDQADLSDDRRAYQRAERIFDAVEPEAIVLAESWFQVAPLEYLHIVEGRRPDVTVLNQGAMSPAELSMSLEAEGRTRPIYATEGTGWLVARYDLAYIKDCNCYKITNRRKGYER